jgi:D-arginine dehydrogenase
MTDRTFDIIVIGAGIAGASVAADLARTHRVAVCEREDFPGYHSTGRSAALFSEIYGNSAVRALSRASREFFYQPPRDFADNPLVQRRGALHIASAQQMRQIESFAANPDVASSVRRMSPDQALDACSILRPDYVAAAVIEDDAADVDVHALHQGYLRELRNRGGVLAVDTHARHLSHRSGEWHVETREGVLRAPVLVNAAGAWADTVARLAGASPLDIQPCRRTAVLVELPANVRADAWPMVIDIDETFYMKPDAGLLLISPADEAPVAPCDVQPEEIDVATAIDRVERATSLKISRVRKRWAGLRSFAPDRSPVIGFDPVLPGFFWLAGQGGYGIQTAPAAAKLAAALLRGHAVPREFADIYPAQLSPRRFAASAAVRSGT